MIEKRGQSSMELVILVGFMIAAIIGFSIMMNQNASDKNYERKNILVNNVIYDIEEEINLAQSSLDGYYREFIVPLDIEGLEYNVSVLGDTLYIKTADGRHSSALRISQVNGQLILGKNTITKIGGSIFLNE